MMTDKYVRELPKCKLCDSYPANYHAGAFGVKHHCDDKHCTLHNVLFTEQQWYTLMGEPEPASAEPVDYRMPWSRLTNSGWMIVGMNHYNMNGSRHLFCSMSRDGICIVAEGSSEEEVFATLEFKAGLKGQQPPEVG